MENDATMMQTPARAWRGAAAPANRAAGLVVSGGGAGFRSLAHVDEALAKTFAAGSAGSVPRAPGEESGARVLRVLCQWIAGHGRVSVARMAQAVELIVVSRRAA